MNYTHTLDARDSTHTLPISSISTFPVLLSTAVALLAVETTMHIFRRRSSEPPPMISDPAATSSQSRSLSDFASKTRRILSDVQMLEEQLALKRETHKQRLHRTKRSRSHDHPRRTPLITTTKHTRHGSLACVVTSHDGQDLSTEFSSFCERLLLVNRIWEQERQLKALRANLETKKKEKEATAFKSFCDQLVHWNHIWRLEREVKALAEEGERLKRGRVAAVTRAAKRMVLDVQKERLVEEFVKDLIDETTSSKREAEELKREHEREIKEIHGEWLKDYRKVARELEKLKLAQEAKLVEQEVSNSMEDSLYESLQAGKKRIEALGAEIAQYRKAVADLSPLESMKEASEISQLQSFPDDETTDVELDALSELSTSSTCVSSFGGSVHRPTKVVRGTAAKITMPLTRKRCISHGGEPPKRSLLFSTHDSSTHTASALRPPTIDQADSMDMKMAASTRICNHSGRPLAIRNRTTSTLSQRVVSPMVRSSGSENKAGGSMIKQRAPWRF